MQRGDFFFDQECAYTREHRVYFGEGDVLRQGRIGHEGLLRRGPVLAKRLGTREVDVAGGAGEPEVFGRFAPELAVGERTEAANPGEIVEVFDADRFARLFHFFSVVGQRAEKGTEFFAGDAFEGVGAHGVLADRQIGNGVGRKWFGRADIDFDPGQIKHVGEQAVAEPDGGGVAVPAEGMLAGFERHTLHGIADDALAGEIPFESGGERGLEEVALRLEVGGFKREVRGEAAVQIERLAFEVEAQGEHAGAFEDEPGTEGVGRSDGREDLGQSFGFPAFELVGAHELGGGEHIPLEIEERAGLAAEERHLRAGRGGEEAAGSGEDRQEGCRRRDAGEIEEGPEPAGQHGERETVEVIGETLRPGAVQITPGFEDHALAATGVGLHEGIEQRLFKVGHAEMDPGVENLRLDARHEVAVTFGGIVTYGVMRERMAAQVISVGCGGRRRGRFGDGALPGQTGRARGRDRGMVKGRRLGRKAVEREGAEEADDPLRLEGLEEFKGADDGLRSSPYFH